jgi:hypothetical protein
MSEEPITLKTAKSWRRSWVIRGVLWSLVIFFFSVMTGCTLMIETPVHFFLGWLFHGIRTLPQILGNWEAFMLPSGCLILAGFLIHRFVQRCLVAQGRSRRLRPTDTIAALSLLLLGCGAAIALSGIVHQAVWLMSDPWTENRRANLTSCVSNARQLMLAITEFHDKKGHYPNSLQELVTELNIPPQLTWVKYGTGKVSEPFILLYPGRKQAMKGEEPLIVSAILERGQKIVVGYGDSSVRILSAKMLNTILENRDLTKSEMQLPP